MEFWLSEMVQHGYAILFLAVFLESIGFPIPAALGLLIAGGAAARGSLSASYALAGSVVVMLVGDAMMFMAGRYTGWWILSALCRLSLNPESCILRSANSFYRRGHALLVIAKFIPGINTMAPPLAGSMNMRFLPFFRLDLTGTVLYIACYFAVGYLFSGATKAITKSYQTMSLGLSWSVGVAVVLYLGFRLWIWFKGHRPHSVPMASPAETVSVMAEGRAAVYDVRSHGYYSFSAVRILSSQRLDPNSLGQATADFPPNKEIFLYCTCVSETTSVLVAKELLNRGVHTRVIKGGLKAWKHAGLPVEMVPKEEIELLPVFS